MLFLLKNGFDENLLIAQHVTSTPSLCVILKKLPRRFIILLPVAFVEGGNVFDGSLDGAAGLGVVGDGAGKDVACRSVLHDAVPRGLPPADRCDCVGLLPFGTIKTHAHQAAVVGENDPPLSVVPGVGLVLLQHRKLDAVDGFELIQGHTQSHSR